MFALESWVFWLLVYWIGSWILFIDWYYHQVKSGKKQRMNLLATLFSLLFIGIVLPIALIAAIFKKL